MAVGQTHDLADALEQPIGLGQAVFFEHGDDPLHVEDDVLEPDLERVVRRQEQMLLRMRRDLSQRRQKMIQLQMVDVTELVLGELLIGHLILSRWGARRGRLSSATPAD